MEAKNQLHDGGQAHIWITHTITQVPITQLCVCNAPITQLCVCNADYTRDYTPC